MKSHCNTLSGNRITAKSRCNAISGNFTGMKSRCDDLSGSCADGESCDDSVSENCAFAEADANSISETVTSEKSIEKVPDHTSPANKSAETEPENILSGNKSPERKQNQMLSETQPVEKTVKRTFTEIQSAEEIQESASGKTGYAEKTQKSTSTTCTSRTSSILRHTSIGIAATLLFAAASFLGLLIAELRAQHPAAAGVPDRLHSHWVDSVFNSLTPDERIGQLFFAAAYSNLGKNHADQIAGLVSKQHIGGLIFFQGGPKKQAILTNRWQSIAKVPMLIGMDAEWGLGMRLDSCISFPRQMALGAIRDQNLIREMGEEIGAQCRRLGVHLNFSPVADINSNPLNPVIGTRSFGENSREAASRAVMYMSGLQNQRILTAAKHFPGHGNTSVDSHLALPVENSSYAALDSAAWFPYREMIRNGLTGVLAAHIHVSALDSTQSVAASLSRRVLTDVLRDSLHFGGLVYTDALNMRSVTQHFASGELEVRALEAGADVLLMPVNIPKAMAAVKAAVESGRISRAQVEMSCRRILAAKEWAGLDRYTPVDTSGMMRRLVSTSAEMLNRRLVEASLTVVQNTDSMLPLKHLDSERTAILLAGTSQSNNFLRTLSLYREDDYYFLDGKASAQLRNDLLDKLGTYTRVIVGIHNTGNYASGTGYGVPSGISSFVDRLAARTDVILCLFAPPYALSSFKNAGMMSSIVVSYQETPVVQDYTAQLLYGAIAGRGVLPVSADSVYRFGTGVYTCGGIRLKYSIPEEVQINAQRLNVLDTMIQNAVKAGAMPGCQVLAARRGVVFLRKEYGHTGYDGKEDVDYRHIYDLASLTKISATLPAIMQLYDSGQIRLNDRLKEHLPEMRDSDKENITVEDILAHQSRLPAYISFYLQTMEPADSGQQLIAHTYSALHNIRLAPKSYLNSRRVFKAGYFSASSDDTHRLKVADSMYIFSAYRDTILHGIRNAALLDRKRYVYSDLGFILLADIAERLCGQRMDDIVSQRFYHRLGAAALGYLPMERFPQGRMVPTVNDTIFRRQWLRGFVHDENAALLGGTAGHAGLFGNANDLAKLMQMYLNGGSYGGERYISGKTLREFTSRPFARQGNRRGLGFDKPELNPKPNDLMGKYSSAKSFGHTGFTGTMVWMDPENGLLYIFLSNRVCPDATNNKLSTLSLRSRIYEALVNAIDPNGE